MTPTRLSLREKVEKFISLNPIMFRGILVTAAAIAARIVGHEVLSDGAIQEIIDFLIAVSALIAAFWGKGRVIEESKVIAWVEDPTDPTAPVVPGPAIIETAEQEVQLQIAATESQTQKEIRS